MDIYKTVKELKQIVEERDTLKATVQSYIETANKISEMGKQLQKLAEEIDPYRGVNTNTSTRKGQQKEIIAELLEVIRNGTTVDRYFVITAYPELTPNQVTYIMDTIRNTAGIKVRKEGVKNYLYV